MRRPLSTLFLVTVTSINICGLLYLICCNVITTEDLVGDDNIAISTEKLQPTNQQLLEPAPADSSQAENRDLEIVVGQLVTFTYASDLPESEQVDLKAQ